MCTFFPRYMTHRTQQTVEVGTCFPIIRIMQPNTSAQKFSHWGINTGLQYSTVLLLTINIFTQVPQFLLLKFDNIHWIPNNCFKHFKHESNLFLPDFCSPSIFSFIGKMIVDIFLFMQIEQYFRNKWIISPPLGFD